MVQTRNYMGGLQERLRDVRPPVRGIDDGDGRKGEEGALLNWIFIVFHSRKSPKVDARVYVVYRAQEAGSFRAGTLMNKMIAAKVASMITFKELFGTVSYTNYPSAQPFAGSL